MTIKEAIQQLADQKHEIYSLVAKVNAVDKDAKTCDVTPLNGDPDIFGVRLIADKAEDGIVIYPKVGSAVVCTWMNKVTGYVGMAGEIESVEGAIGNFKWQLNADGLVFNGGGNGGMVITPKLAEELAKMKALVEGIKKVLTTWIPVPNDGGAALKAEAAAVLAVLQAGDYDSLEDKKIKH